MNAVRRVEFGEFSEEQRRILRAGEALHRDGASPAGALELLAAIVEDCTWEKVADAKGRSFKGRFREFVEARAPYGLGCDPDQLRKVLALQHPHEAVPDVAYRMASMREQVRSLLLAEIPVASASRGRTVTERNSRDGATIPTITQSNSCEHVVSRLKRDDPAMAEKVIKGEISPNAAAREKGWRKPRIILSSPERIAESLRRHMPHEALLRLVELLTKED